MRAVIVRQALLLEQMGALAASMAAIRGDPVAASALLLFSGSRSGHFAALTSPWKAKQLRP